MKVLTKPNINGGLDVVIENANTVETVAIRNAFSDIVDNRRYAQAHCSRIISALRENKGLTKYHEEYKDSGRREAWLNDHPQPEPKVVYKEVPVAVKVPFEADGWM